VKGAAFAIYEPQRFDRLEGFAERIEVVRYLVEEERGRVQDDQSTGDDDMEMPGE
jgi:hypothetical protein